VKPVINQTRDMMSKLRHYLATQLDKRAMTENGNCD